MSSFSRRRFLSVASAGAALAAFPTPITRAAGFRLEASREFGPRVAMVREDILEWLESIRWKGGGGGPEARGLWGRWPYHARMSRPYAVIGSAQGIGLLQSLGALDAVPLPWKQEAVSYFQSCQDAADGHFKDPLVSEADHIDYHSWVEIWGQMGAASGALSSLGAEPLFPRPPVMHVDIGAVDGKAYTRSFDWSNPWKNGEGWTRGIRARLDSSKSENLQGNIAEAVATYEAEVLDPVTGFPLKQMDPSRPDRLVVAMCGLFKTMGTYLALGAPVPYAERAIDATLALQENDGAFGGPLTQNWDALWVLRELDLQMDGSYRHADIMRSGDRCCDLLLKEYRKSDGGFSFNRNGCADVHHSVRLSPESYPISDTMGTRMSLNCLMYVDEWEAV